MTHAIFDKPLSCFITGTDTEVGKTLVSSALVHLQAQKGYKVAGMKPVAAGTVIKGSKQFNEDVDALMRASSVSIDQNLVCPYLFKTPVAPHIACEMEGQLINPDHILECFNQINNLSEAVVVEGVGGFRVPLTNKFDTADLAVKLNLPVIMVVGLRLGCINHALLTMEAIQSRRLNLIGWVANAVNPDMDKSEENLTALKNRIQAPLLGHIPHLVSATFGQAVKYF